MKKAVLGRGLDALIGKRDVTLKESESSIRMLEIDEIKVTNYQPRHQFDKGSLDDLKRSILEKGIIQPLLVRKSAGGYQLIAGERRLRAAEEAGIKQVPVIVKDIVNDAELLEISLVENIQRQDLNPLEKARGYKRLGEEFGLTQEDIAQKVGQERSSVTNTLRLLELDDEIKAMIEKGEISFGQAKVLLSIDEPDKRLEYAKLIRTTPISVRRLEIMVRSKSRRKRKASLVSGDIHLQDVESRLRDALQTRVTIRIGKGKTGRIEIEYYSDEDRERIISRLISIQ